ncbi:MAG TPA: hypothetical protein VJX67_23805 [Blastocatellia bacterium]|nr:hypothetical protein [Blastocatellia bacterium]
MESMRIGSHNGERGAVKIKTALIFLGLAIGLAIIIKIAPVYVDQQEVEHDSDELARKVSVGMPPFNNPDRIARDVKQIIADHGLPEGSIVITSHDNTAEVTVKYTKQIDFLVTTYDWTVDYVNQQKGI